MLYFNMKLFVVFLTLSQLLFPFEMKKIYTGKWNYEGAVFHKVLSGYSILKWKGVSIAVNPYGKRLFTIPTKYLIVKKDKTFVLEKKALIQYGREGLENIWEIENPVSFLEGFPFNVIKDKDSLVLTYLKNPIYKKHTNYRELVVYKLKKGVFKEVWRKKTGFYIHKMFSTDEGYLFVAPQVLNGFIYNGFTDLKAGVGIISRRGKLVSHLNLFGLYNYPKLYKIKNDKAYIVWSEIWVGKKRAGAFILNLKNWRIEKEIGFNQKNKTFEFAHGLLPLSEDFPLLFFTLEGNILILDDNLKTKKKIRIGVKKISCKENEFARVRVKFIGKIKKYYLMYVVVQKKSNDPRIHLPVFLENHLFILNKQYELIKHIKTQGNDLLLFDTEENIISVVKGGKIEVYKIVS